MNLKIRAIALVAVPLFLLTGCMGEDVFSAEVREAKAQGDSNTDPTKGWVHIKSVSEKNEFNALITTGYWIMCEETSLIELTATPLAVDGSEGAYDGTRVETPNSTKCAEAE